MTTTLLKRSKGSASREAAARALREAGVGVVEVDDWSDAAGQLADSDAALVLCTGAQLEGLDGASIVSAVAALSGHAGGAPIPHEKARKLSHDLRTPLSAMAGWVHLIESGKLDEAGIKRAAGKLRGNIDDQVRMIEHFMGAIKEEGRQ